jgi:hypothetical protein
MSAFWESVAANIVGTFVGAGLALLTSYLVVRHGETRNDLRLLQALIDRMHLACLRWREIGSATAGSA